MRIMPDFGNVRDNGFAFDIASSYITNGDVEWGGHILAGLQDFIQETKEAKSLHWILPKVVEALEYLDSCTSTTSSNETLGKVSGVSDAITCVEYSGIPTEGSVRPLLAGALDYMGFPYHPQSAS